MGCKTPNKQQGGTNEDRDLNLSPRELEGEGGPILLLLPERKKEAEFTGGCFQLLRLSCDFSEPALLPAVTAVPALFDYSSTAEMSRLVFTLFPQLSKGQLPEQGSPGWGASILSEKKIKISSSRNRRD